MTKFSSVLALSIAFLPFLSTDASAITFSVSDVIYQHARFGNYQQLNFIKKKGYSIDEVNDSGNTALCTAILNKDKKAYKILREMGANPHHECVSQFVNAQPPEQPLFGTAMYVGAAAVATGGLIVGIAGTGSGEGNGDGSSSGEGDNPEIVDGPLTEQYFENAEYIKGNFLPAINASQAYVRFFEKDEEGNLVSNLERVKVGIIDTGVNADHTDFAGKTITGYNYDYGPCSKSGKTTNCWTWSSGKAILRNEAGITKTVVLMTEDAFKNWEKGYEDGYDWEEVSQRSTAFYPGTSSSLQHGTHIAGIIAANFDRKGMYGVAFDNADLIATRWDFMSMISDPVVKMIEDGAQVINMSFGIDSDESINASTVLMHSLTLSSYINLFTNQTLLDSDTIFVVAAGNEGQEQPSILTGLPLLSVADDRFAHLDNLFISVVAVNTRDKQIANYSNHCGVTKDYCISAPGTMLYSTVYDSAYGEKNGTSMATPVVSGSLAFLLGAYPYMTPQEVVQLIFDTADDLGEPGTDEIYGRGLLNLERATQPQGPLEIATTSTVNGSGVHASSLAMNVPANFQMSVKTALPKSVTAFDKYKRPFDVRLSSLVRTTHNNDYHFRNDLRAFSRYHNKTKIRTDSDMTFAYAPAVMKNYASNGLGMLEFSYSGEKNTFGFYFAENTIYNTDNYFDKTLSNPFLAMNATYGIYHQYNLTSKLGLTMNFSTGENGLYDGSREARDNHFDNRMYALDTALSFSASKNITLTALGGISYEDDAMLGLNGKGAFTVPDSQTYYGGIKLSWAPLKNIRLSGAYYRGWTDTGDFNSDLVKTTDLISDGFAFDGHYQYNKTDVVGLQISSPLRINSGQMKFNLPVGRDDYSDKVYRQQFVAHLKPNAREYKFSLYHGCEVNENMNLKTAFDVRLNPDHRKNSTTDYRLMVGYSWTFN